HHRVAHALTPKPVHRGVGQDALEQQRQLRNRTVGILLGQPDHRILHDVKRRLVIAHGVGGSLERPLLDALEKVGQFVIGRQCGKAGCSSPGFFERRDYRIGFSGLSGGRLGADSDDIMLLRTTLLVHVRRPTADERVMHRAGSTSTSRGCEEGHRWIFVREIHRGSRWTCLLRRSSAPLRRPRKPILPASKRSTALKSSSAACRPKGSSTSGATPAARCFTSTTRCTSSRASSTCWCATSRPLCMPPTATLAPPAT